MVVEVIQNTEVKMEYTFIHSAQRQDSIFISVDNDGIICLLTRCGYELYKWSPLNVDDGKNTNYTSKEIAISNIIESHNVFLLDNYYELADFINYVYPKYNKQ